MVERLRSRPVSGSESTQAAQVLRELERELESTARAQQAAASERAQQAAEQPATIYTLSRSLSLSRPVMHLVRMNWAVNWVWHTGRQKTALERGKTHTFSRRKCNPRYGLRSCECKREGGRPRAPCNVVRRKARGVWVFLPAGT